MSAASALVEGLTERMQVVGGLVYPHLTRTHPPFMPPEKRRFTATLVPPISALFEIEAAISRVALAAWRDGVEYRSPLRYRERVRGGCWCITAINPDLPICRDRTGMPERPDLFCSGQTVEMDIVFFTYEYTVPDVRPKYEMRGVSALLKGVKFVGGFVRGTE